MHVKRLDNRGDRKGSGSVSDPFVINPTDNAINKLVADAGNSFSPKDCSNKFSFYRFVE